MSLSSLIVQREIASIRAVEEALARQVLYGGDLATNLLEVAHVEEWRLAVLVAESFGLAVAPAGELPLPTERARSLVPSELALRRSLLPLDADDEHIVVVLAEPLSPEDEAQLAFALGLRVEQRIGLYVRVRQALARAYGAPLERRMDRLLAKLSGAPPPSGPSSQPPLLHDRPNVTPPPRPPSTHPQPASDIRAPRETRRGFPATEVLIEDASIHTAVTAPPPDAPAAPLIVGLAPVMRIDEASVHTAVTAPPAAAVTATAPPIIPPLPRSEISAGAPPRRSTQPLPVVTDAVEVRDDTPTVVPPALTFVRPGGATPRPVRRRRGPLTFDAAKEELEQSSDRDVLLDLLFDFCRQFFDYSALFIVRDELAEGRDAFGDGLSREKIVGIAVPLGEPSMLHTAREEKRAVVLEPDLAPHGNDAVLLGDLQRAERVKNVFVMPIVVRKRTVALFYGDAGMLGVDETAIKDAIEIGKMTGRAFERIIVRKKLAGFSAGSGEAARVDVDRVMPKSRPTPLPAVARASEPSSRAQPPIPVRSRAEAFKRAVFGQDSLQARPTPFETPLARGPMPPVLEPSQASPPPPSPPTAPEDLPGPRNDQTVIVEEKPTTWRKRQSSMPPPGAKPAFYTPPPPPPTVTAVRRPSGPPIPREEPDVVDAGDAVVIEAPRAPMPSDPEIDAVSIDDETAHELLREIEMQERAAFAVAYGPRKPPMSRKALGALPSVIVDTDGEYAVLVDRLLAGDEDAEAELLRDGVAAMPAIMARFPGPLRVARDRLKEPLPRVGDCGPILNIIARERRVALPFVLPFVSSDDVEARTWATFLLTELAYAEAVEGLVPRLFDTDPRVRLVARAAARSMSSVAQEALLAALGRVLRDPRATRHGKIGVLETLGDIREPLAVPLLIRYLEDEDEEIATVARRALIQITRRDFARESKKWLGWWGANSNRHRIEWLIDALDDDTPGIRRAAGDELKALTSESFGYYDNLPKLERERAQQRFRDWWASEGKARFSR